MLLVASSVLAQSGYDKGASAYKRGDLDTAMAVFRPLAENGDAKAQSILGLMYSYGEGVPVDYREAARWYRRAAEQSSSVAQYNLGMFYLEGKGVSQNTDEAISWLDNERDPNSPFFLNIWLHEPHAPIAAPDEIVSQYGNLDDPAEIYTGTVDHTDRAIKRLVAKLHESVTTTS